MSKNLGIAATCLLAAIPTRSVSGETPVQRSPLARYAEVAARIVGAELVLSQAYAILQHLTDRIGPRLSGSPGAEAAVRWTRERLAGDGLLVRLEPVTVPHWVRGVEEAEIVAPNPQKLVVRWQ